MDYSFSVSNYEETTRFTTRVDCVQDSRTDQEYFEERLEEVFELFPSLRFPVILGLEEDNIEFTSTYVGSCSAGDDGWTEIEFCHRYHNIIFCNHLTAVERFLDDEGNTFIS